MNQTLENEKNVFREIAFHKTNTPIIRANKKNSVELIKYLNVNFFSLILAFEYARIKTISMFLFTLKKKLIQQ